MLQVHAQLVLQGILIQSINAGNHELEPQGNGRYFLTSPWGLDNGRQFNSYLARFPTQPLSYQSGGAPLYFSTEVGPVHYVSNMEIDKLTCLSRPRWKDITKPLIRYIQRPHHKMDEVLLILSSPTLHLGRLLSHDQRSQIVSKVELLPRMWEIEIDSCWIRTNIVLSKPNGEFSLTWQWQSLQIVLNNYENFLVGSPQFKWLQNNLNTWVFLFFCLGSLFLVIVQVVELNDPTSDL